MPVTAVKVRELGKRYRIGVRRQSTSRGSRVVNSLLSPFDYFRTSLRDATDEETLWALRDVSFDVYHGDVLGIVAVSYTHLTLPTNREV